MDVAAGSSRLGDFPGSPECKWQARDSHPVSPVSCAGQWRVCVSPAPFSITEAGFGLQLEENACWFCSGVWVSLCLLHNILLKKCSLFPDKTCKDTVEVKNHHDATIMDWTSVSPSNSCVGALTPKVMGIWWWCLWEVIRSWVHEGTVLLMGFVSTQKRDKWFAPPALSVPVRTQWQVAICKPGREASPETKSAGTLILDVEPLELWEINVFCFVIAARDSSDSCYPEVTTIHILVSFQLFFQWIDRKFFSFSNCGPALLGFSFHFVINISPDLFYSMIFTDCIKCHCYSWSNYTALLYSSRAALVKYHMLGRGGGV